MANNTNTATMTNATPGAMTPRDVIRTADVALIGAALALAVADLDAERAKRKAEQPFDANKINTLSNAVGMLSRWIRKGIVVDGPVAQPGYWSIPHQANEESPRLFASAYGCTCPHGDFHNIGEQCKHSACSDYLTRAYNARELLRTARPPEPPEPPDVVAARVREMDELEATITAWEQRRAKRAGVQPVAPITVPAVWVYECFECHARYMADPGETCPGCRSRGRITPVEVAPTCPDCYGERPASGPCPICGSDSAPVVPGVVLATAATAEGAV